MQTMVTRVETLEEKARTDAVSYAKDGAGYEDIYLLLRGRLDIKECKRIVWQWGGARK